MANLKSITELPVAESADGLNLIVNDNGAAKQIAASAVGAQADFAVTDENSPAFIKNKPGYAQADFAVTDETNPAFIKNKPFYDTREFGTITATFDGDLNGKEFVVFDENFGGYVKLSDKIPSKEELIGGILKTTAPDGVQTLEITEEMVMTLDGVTAVVPDSDNSTAAFIIIPQELITDDVPFTSAGMWAMYGLADGVPVFYVSEFSWNSVVSGELKTIEPKYVKDMYYTKITEDVEILAETTIEIPEDNYIELQTPMVLDLASGMDYIVNWNGNSHICKANFDGEWFCLEAVDVFSIQTYPYLFINEGYYAEINIYDGSTSVTLSITGPSAEVKKIDAKYMPDDIIYGIIEIHNGIDDVRNVANNKMDKTNPVSTGSFSMNRKSGTTIGSYSHAEGYNTTASGNSSHAEGSLTTASEYCSHAEGMDTEASGVSSHAEGGQTFVSGNYSHAEGFQTKSVRRSQHIQGEYNILDTEGGDVTARGKYVHIVGNGTADAKRSNAHTLDWNGNAWYQGTVEGTGFILTSPDGTRYKITVANDGTLSAVAV